jgi:hypothetical protein
MKRLEALVFLGSRLLQRHVSRQPSRRPDMAQHRYGHSADRRALPGCPEALG